MSGKITAMRSLAFATGFSMLAAAAAAAQTATQTSPPINQTPAPGQTLTPTQPQLQELPSVADLADRLLPAVVEITIESAGDSSGGGGDRGDDRLSHMPSLSWIEAMNRPLLA